MAIQYISFNKKQYSNFICNTFDSFDLIDKYDLTIIDMSEQCVWDGQCNSIYHLPVENIIERLNETIANSTKKKVLYLLPQNIIWKNINQNGLEKKLSDIRSNFLSTIKNVCFLGDDCSFSVIKNTTVLKNGTEVESDFIFKYDYNFYTEITTSKYSNHPTSIRHNYTNIIYTFLKLNSELTLINYLETIGFCFENYNLPKWLDDYMWFDDSALHKAINKEEELIKNASEAIEKCKKRLDKNSFFKKALVSQGDELVNIVLTILGEILEIDTSTFVDLKKHDFEFSADDTTYLFEIKGISTNVKNVNVTQLDVHESRYIDDLNEKGLIHPNDIKKILIINHQREKEVSQREPINVEQVNLAIKKEVLIIETITLLAIFEKYKNGYLNKAGFLNLISNNIGQLHL